MGDQFGQEQSIPKSGLGRGRFDICSLSSGFISTKLGSLCGNDLRNVVRLVPVYIKTCEDDWLQFRHGQLSRVRSVAVGDARVGDDSPHIAQKLGVRTVIFVEKRGHGIAIGEIVQVDFLLALFIRLARAFSKARGFVCGQQANFVRMDLRLVSESVAIEGAYNIPACLYDIVTMRGFKKENFSAVFVT